MTTTWPPETDASLNSWVEAPVSALSLLNVFRASSLVKTKQMIEFFVHICSFFHIPT